MNTQSFFISAPRSLLFASLLLGASLTPLAAQAIEVNGIVKLGTDFGGDELVKAVFTSGSSSSITANGGILLAGGVSLSNASRTFSVDTTVGWKSDLIDALNQSYEFSRNTFDVVAFFGIPLGEKSAPPCDWAPEPPTSYIPNSLPVAHWITEQFVSKMHSEQLSRLTA